MFLRLQTQWIVAQGTVVGLNYDTAIQMMRLHKVQDKKTMLEDLRLMESAALAIMNQPEK